MVSIGHVLGNTAYGFAHLSQNPDLQCKFQLETPHHYQYPLSIFVLLFTLFFMFAVTSLFLTQLKNFMSNRTTNERFSRKAYRSGES